MDKRFQDWDVEQGWLFPPSVLDLVPANHPAHFVRELVRSELELSAIFDDYAPGAGAPPYHPAMMTALEAEAKAKEQAARPARKNKGGRAPKPPSETPPDKAQRNFTDPESRIMRTRLRRGGHRSRYRLRKQTAEPVFGQIKEAKGFRRFLMRGLEKVRREWSLVCTAHNMRKLQAARA